MPDKALSPDTQAEFDALLTGYTEQGFTVLSDEDAFIKLTGKNPLNPFAVLFWILVPIMGWIIIAIMALKAFHGGYIIQIQKPDANEVGPESAD